MAARSIVSDVAAQFRSLNARGERLAVIDGFPSIFADKRYSLFHKKQGLNNHFQGVQRIGNHLLVTGSFPYEESRSDLLVFRLGSRGVDPGPWGSNLTRDRNPTQVDRLANYFQIDHDFWHPGGFSLVGDVAAVPLENFAGDSKVVFLDVSNPEEPVPLPDHTVDRPGFRAGACAATPLPDGRVLLAVWSDSDEAEPPVTAAYHLDLYVGGAGMQDWSLAAHFHPPATHAFHRRFQSMDFVWEAAPTGIDALYLIGFENTSEAQPNPLDTGENRAYLFRVALDLVPLQPSAEPAELPELFMSLVDSKLFDPGGNWCNMDAGSCAYVDSSQQLILYSVYHFLTPIRSAALVADLAFKCLEFRATNFADPVTRLEDGWVDLYAEAGLAGRHLALLGAFDVSIEETKRVFADDQPFTATASVRYQLPDGVALVLYPQPGFTGEPALVLTGSGSVKEVDVHGAGFGGAFRSCRLQPESVAVVLPGAIVV
jgi:hypothetical protein